MSVSTERLILDPAAAQSVDGSLIATQPPPFIDITTPDSIRQAPSDIKMTSSMSDSNILQRAEKLQYDSMIDVKENMQDDRINNVHDPYTEEAERLQVFAGPKVQVKILLMNSQNHVFVFEPETTIGRVKESIWHLWPSGESREDRYKCVKLT
ncbi:hypothetical protein QFC22_001721 [Naganishia vaughanmartiniae]|uniref:Uncharacterized protein n=1 Tax=Naganishia vaughanmartiniae TaxID=1424756 RepID=A0ACC2XFB7_9TREE|nr:hypothetical protein QFC22_001721 [Naganishia vaughanmartiniae]